MATSLYDKNYARAVSDIFLEHMSAQGKTIEKIAQATKTKYHTLFRYLNGSRQMPIDLFQKICVCNSCAVLQPICNSETELSRHRLPLNVY